MKNCFWKPLALVHKLEHSLTATTYSGSFRCHSSSFRCHSGSFRCHSGSFRYIPVHSGPFRFIPVHSGPFRSIPVHSGPFRCHSSLFRSFPVHFGVIPVHSGPFHLIPVHSAPFRCLVTPTCKTIYLNLSLVTCISYVLLKTIPRIHGMNIWIICQCKVQGAMHCLYKQLQTVKI